MLIHVLTGHLLRSRLADDHGVLVVQAPEGDISDSQVHTQRRFASVVSVVRASEHLAFLYLLPNFYEWRLVQISFSVVRKILI